MPQAFGPFSDPSLAASMREVAAAADLLFPRDSVSVRYLRELGVSPDKLEQFPDFTHEVPALRRASYPEPGSYFCVIPNAKLTSGKTPQRMEDYLRFLVNSSALLARKLGARPVLLRFGGREDAALIELLEERITGAPRSVLVSDPRYAKGLIASSVAVVSSRFHAIMSALGSNVPCLAVGWSHKYGEAMEEHGCAEYSLSLGAAEVDSVLERFAGDVTSGRLAELLAVASEKQRAATDRMWQKVIACMSHD
jgi:colanic acid/amylovoran biosynthesis protein